MSGPKVLHEWKTSNGYSLRIVEFEGQALLDGDSNSTGWTPALAREIACLRAELDAWKARMKALTGSDQPDAAGNAVISLRAELESARKAVTGPFSIPCPSCNNMKRHADGCVVEQFIRAACEGKR